MAREPNKNGKRKKKSSLDWSHVLDVRRAKRRVIPPFYLQSDVGVVHNIPHTHIWGYVERGFHVFIAPIIAHFNPTKAAFSRFSHLNTSDNETLNLTTRIHPFFISFIYIFNRREIKVLYDVHRRLLSTFEFRRLVFFLFCEMRIIDGFRFQTKDEKLN